MAKTSLKVRASRPAKFSTRRVNRCQICGRPRAYYRKFQVCRLCFRRLANEGQVPGLVRASW
jgi:small subunit ribosomal protein S14